MMLWGILRATEENVRKVLTLRSISFFRWHQDVYRPKDEYSVRWNELISSSTNIQLACSAIIEITEQSYDP